MIGEITMKANENTRLSKFLRIFGIVSSLICIYAGLQTFFFFEGSVPGTALDFYHSAGIFFIGIGLFVGSFLWGISALIDKN